MESRWVDGGGVLIGQGLACALGYDALTAMAAARAGISRAAEQAHIRLRSAVTGVEQPVAAHAAALLTAGFEDKARLRRLATHAWAQLQASLAELPATDWGRVGLYVALPDPNRPQSCAALMRPAPAQAPAQGADGVGDLARALARGLTRDASGVPEPTTLFWSAAGHAAGTVAAAAGLRDLNEGRVDTALVLALDSLLDEDTVAWLAETSRLKSDGAPDGLMPGEAAAAFAIRRRGEAEGGWACIEGVAIAEEPKTQESGATSTGEALALSIAEAHARAPGEPAWVLGDHNGEHYRAHEWGVAMVRLRALHPAFAAPAFWWPALSFGDAGAASGVLGAMMAGHAWRRGCAPGASALVASSAEAGLRAALLLTQR